MAEELPTEALGSEEHYLAKIAGEDVPLPNEPRGRKEHYLAYIAENGGGGGGGGGGGTTNFNHLTNRPKYNGTVMSGSTDIPAVTESTVSGWGFTKNTGTYNKPINGIPKTDLESAVQTSLGKADTAIQDVSGKQDKLTAGSNITIASDGKTISATNTTYEAATESAAGLMSAADKTKLDGISSGAGVNVKSDWTENDSNSDAYILNKPTIPVVNNSTITVQMNGSTVDTFTTNAASAKTINLGTVVTDVSGKQNTIDSSHKLSADLVDDTSATNKFVTAAEKTKLSGIATGAEVNVQANWNETNTGSDAYIQNKPNISGKEDKANVANYIETIVSGPTDNEIENTQTKLYIDNVTYTSDYSSSSIGTYNITTSYRKDEPFGYIIDLSSVSENGTIIVNDLEGRNILTDSVSASDSSYTIYNLLPNKTYYCLISNSSKVIHLGKIRPSGPLRMVYAPSINNVRDLGGWACNGGTVKYGLLFRGGEMDGNSGVQITSADKNRLLGLGVTSDLDFRYTVEGAGGPSPLGGDVDYLNTAIGAYEGLDPANDVHYTRYKTALDRVMSKVTNGEATYFHCISGADRTGTFAALVEGVLGVSQSDIDKDYELTTFSNEGAEASRSRTFNRWINMINYLLGLGGDIEHGAINYLLLLGYTADQINSFRQNMIDGEPTTITTHSVSYSLTHTTSSNTLTAVCKGSTFTATMSAESGYALSTFTCTMGGAPQTVSGGTVTITNVTGDIVVTAVSTSQVVYDWVDMDPTITYGLKLSSSDGSEAGTGQTQYSASEKVQLGDTTSVRLSNTYKTGSWEGSAQMYYYDSNDTLLEKGTSISHATSTTTITDTPPSGATYARIRIYHATTQEQAQAFDNATTLEYYKTVS